MGAGIVECDVTFTKDKELVCRHSQCDLHTTTEHPRHPRAGGEMLAALHAGRPGRDKAGEREMLHQRHHPRRVPAPEGQDGRLRQERDDGARTTWPARQIGGPISMRRRRHADDPCREHQAVQGARRQIHARAEGAERADAVRRTSPQEAYAQKLVDEYKAAGIDPKDVFAQSFDLETSATGSRTTGDSASQAVYLDERDERLPGFDPMKPESWKPT